jgi:hypothetical protein
MEAYKGHSYCRTVCFPTTKIGVKTWKLGNEIPIGEPSAFGTVFEACRDANCDYVLKCMGETTKEKVEHEVHMQNLCADAGLCPPVTDSWVCDDEQGGAIIMPILDITLKTRLKNTPDSREQWEMIREALILIGKLHTEAGIIHGDAHLGNFMFDKQGKLMLIDMGESEMMPTRSHYLRFQGISNDYDRFRGMLFQMTRKKINIISPDFYAHLKEKIKPMLHVTWDKLDWNKEESDWGTDDKISLINKLEERYIQNIASLSYDELMSRK